MALIALLLGGLVAGCTATQQGAVAGGAIGAGTGAIIGHQSGHGGEGALIGAGIGALSGALIGHGMDESREQPPVYRSGGGRYYSARECDPGERIAEGRHWVPEHYEYHTCTAPDGSIYEKEILVPGHYE